MKAGIDFGASLVKSVWMKSNEYKFYSTADSTLEEIKYHMETDGISTINIGGIRYNKNLENELKNFKINKLEGNVIENEIKIQSKGVKKLLENELYKEKDFLLVSVGTGTSYTMVSENKITRLPGSSFGGGIINSLGKILGAESYQEIGKANGKSLDLLIKDVLPETEGTFEGELIIANFGKAERNSKKEELYTTLINTVAVSIIKDIRLMDSLSKIPNNIVYIGSTISNTKTLKDRLDVYSKFIGKSPYFPNKGEFSLAIGLYHTGDKNGI